MAFSSAVVTTTIMGNKKVTWGTYNGAAVTTGNLNTGLSVCETLQLSAGGSSVVTEAPTINSTFPIAGSSVPIIFTSGTTGFWMAIGQ